MSAANPNAMKKIESFTAGCCKRRGGQSVLLCSVQRYGGILSVHGGWRSKYSDLLSIA
jgi:hypothetical protein